MNEHINKINDIEINELNLNASAAQTLEAYISSDDEYLSGTKVQGNPVSVSISSTLSRPGMLKSTRNTGTDGNYISNTSENETTNELILPSFTSPEDIAAYIDEHIIYEPEMSDEWQTAAETLAKGTGDCEDIALLAQKLLTDIGVQAVTIKVGTHAVCVWTEQNKDGSITLNCIDQNGKKSFTGDTASDVFSALFSAFNSTLSSETVDCLAATDADEKLTTAIRYADICDPEKLKAALGAATYAQASFSVAGPTWDKEWAAYFTSSQQNKIAALASSTSADEWQKIQAVIVERWNEYDALAQDSRIKKSMRAYYRQCADIVARLINQPFSVINTKLFNGTATVPTTAPTTPATPVVTSGPTWNSNWSDYFEASDIANMIAWARSTDPNDWQKIQKTINDRWEAYGDLANDSSQSATMRAYYQRCADIVARLVNQTFSVINTKLFNGTATVPTTAPTTPLDPVTPDAHMTDAYKDYLGLSDVVALETMAKNGQWNTIRTYLENLADYCEAMAKVTGNNYYQTKADSIHKLAQQSNTDLNQKMFNNTGSLTLTAGMPDISSTPATTVLPYTYTPGDSTETVINGLIENAQAELLNLSQFYTLYTSDYSTATTTDELKMNRPTGYIIFDEKKWVDYCKQMVRAQNLLQLLIMLTQAKGNSRNLVESEMLGDKAQGYEAMKLGELENQKSQYISRFQKKFLNEQSKNLREYNNLLREGTEKAYKDAQDDKTWFDKLRQYASIFLGIIAALAVSASTLGTGSAIAVALLSGLISNNINAIILRDQVQRSKMLASLEESFARVAKAQVDAMQKTDAEIEAEEARQEQLYNDYQNDPSEYTLQLFLETAMQFSADSTNAEALIASTVNGYQVFASGRALNLLLRARALSSLMQMYARLMKQKKADRSSIHQELTGVGGYDSPETSSEVVQQKAEELLTLFQRKIEASQRTVSAFNKAKQLREEAKRASMRYQLSMLQGTISTALNALTAGIGGGLAAALSVGNGFTGGVLNFMVVQGTQKAGKDYDPARIDWSDPKNAGKTAADVDATAALQEHLNNNAGATANLPVFDVSTALYEEIATLNTDTLSSSITDNRAVFNGTEAANIQSRINKLDTMQMVYTKTFIENNSSRDRVHKELTQSGSETMSDTAVNLQNTEASIHKEALNFKFSEVQQKINAQNVQAQHKTEIDSARYGILLSTLSGAFGGISQAFNGNNTVIQGFAQLGQTLTDGNGLGGQLVQLVLQDADINIDTHADDQDDTFTGDQNNSLDQILAENDASHYSLLTETDSSGNAVAVYDLLAAKLEQINRTINIQKAMNSVHKATANVRDLIHAEITSMSRSKEGINTAEVIDKNATSHYFSQLQLLFKHVETLAQTETARNKAIIKFDRSIYKTLFTSAFTTMGISVAEGNAELGSTLFGLNDLLGAGMDVYFAAMDLRDQELQNTLNSGSSTEHILEQRKGLANVNTLEHLDSLESQLQLELLKMNGQGGDFGMTTLDLAAKSYVESMLRIIEELRDRFMDLNKQIKRSRRTLHAVIGNKSTSSTDLANSVQETNSAFVKAVTDQIESQKQTLTTLQSEHSQNLLTAATAITTAGISSISALANISNAGSKDITSFKSVMDSVEKLGSMTNALVKLSLKNSLKDSVSAEQVSFSGYDASLLSGSDLIAIEAGAIETENALEDKARSIMQGIEEELGKGMIQALDIAKAQARDQAMLNDIERILRKERLASLKKDLELAENNWMTVRAEIKALLDMVPLPEEGNPARDIVRKNIKEIEGALNSNDWQGARTMITTLFDRNKAVTITPDLSEKRTKLLAEGDEAFKNYTKAKKAYEEKELLIAKEAVLVKNAYRTYMKESSRANKLFTEINSIMEEKRNDPVFRKQLANEVSECTKGYHMPEQLRMIYAKYPASEDDMFSRIYTAFETGNFNDLSVDELLIAFSYIPAEQLTKLSPRGNAAADLLRTTAAYHICRKQMLVPARTLALFYNEFSAQLDELITAAKVQEDVIPKQVFLSASSDYLYYSSSADIPNFDAMRNSMSFNAQLQGMINRYQEEIDTLEEKKTLNTKEKERLKQLRNAKAYYSQMLINKAMAQADEVPGNANMSDTEASLSRKRIAQIEKNLTVLNTIDQYNRSTKEIIRSAIVSEKREKALKKKEAMEKRTAYEQATRDLAVLRATFNSAEYPLPYGKLNCSESLKRYLTSRSSVLGTEITEQNEELIMRYAEKKAEMAELEYIRAEQAVYEEEQLLDYSESETIQENFDTLMDAYTKALESYVELCNSPVAVPKEDLERAYKEYCSKKEDLDRAQLQVQKKYDTLQHMMETGDVSKMHTLNFNMTDVQNKEQDSAAENNGAENDAEEETETVSAS